MNDVYRVEYFVASAEDKPGAGARLTQQLEQEKVNLIGMLAFPSAAGRMQVDLVAEHPEQLAKAAKKTGLQLQGPKTAFLVQGADRPGAMSEILGRVGNAGINVTATLGVACGGNRFGALLWVKPEDVEAAGRALGAKTAAHHV
jgi:hypothetical protein